MVVLNKDNFEAEVLKSDQLVMVDFWTETCDKCMEIMPDVVALSEQYADKMKFCKLDIKGNRRLAMAQKVMGLPSMVFYKNGESIAKVSGEDLEKSDIEDKIKELI